MYSTLRCSGDENNFFGVTRVRQRSDARLKTWPRLRTETGRSIRSEVFQDCQAYSRRLGPLLRSIIS